MDAPHIEFAGQKRYLACYAPLGASPYERYGDQVQVLPADQLVMGRIDVDLPIADQKQTSACTGYSSHYAVTAAHALRASGDLVRLSPTYAYSKINGGRDAGGSIQALFQALEQYGAAPLELFPESCLFPGQGDPQADAAAQRFRIQEGLLCTSAQEIVTAVSRREIPVMGIQVGSNFAQVDAEGVSPPPRQIIGGHALAVMELYQSPRWGLCVGGPNSWGSQFGKAGWYRVPVSAYLRGQVMALVLKSLVPDPSTDGPKVQS